VHVWLCQRYDVSPWKLAGWGMYSAPRPRTLGMEVWGRDAATGSDEQLRLPTPALTAEGAAFLERWRWLGRLARPDRFATAVLAARPGWSHLRIEAYRSHLDPRTGMVDLRRDDRYYERAPDGARSIDAPGSPS
jgi:hypothetical protein